MEFIFFPNGMKVDKDGRTIYLPNGSVIKLSEEGEILSADKNSNIIDVKYPFTCFDFIGENERSKVARYFARGRNFYNNENERRFFEGIAEALAVVKYDYYIARYPASVDSKRRIYFREDATGSTGYTKKEWETMAKCFYPQCNSDIATLHEYLIWIGYNILENRWNLNAWCTENEVAENDAFLHTRKLVRYKDEFIRCGYNKNITRSPSKVPIKISYGNFEDFNVSYPCAYTGIVVLRP